MASDFEKLITRMAINYLDPNATMKSVAEKFKVSETTVSKYLNKILPMFDLELSISVQKKKAINIAKSKQNFNKKDSGKVISDTKNNNKVKKSPFWFRYKRRIILPQ